MWIFGTLQRCYWIWTINNFVSCGTSLCTLFSRRLEAHINPVIIFFMCLKYILERGWSYTRIKQHLDSWLKLLLTVANVIFLLKTMSSTIFSRTGLMTRHLDTLISKPAYSIMDVYPDKRTLRLLLSHTPWKKRKNHKLKPGWLRNSKAICSFKVVT